MKTANHPILKLIVNEDGTRMWYNGKKLDIKTYKTERDNYPVKRVAFASRTHSVAKLVCEAWNGLREEMTQVVHRKDKDTLNNHYTNLYWSKRGNIHTSRTARDYRSKVKKNELPQVLKRLEAGETLNKIAKSYNTSDMAIHRIKKRFMLNRLSQLKDGVRNATNTHARQQAYAHYMGYQTLAEAITNHGSKAFKNKIDALARTF